MLRLCSNRRQETEFPAPSALRRLKQMDLTLPRLQTETSIYLEF